MKTQQFLIFSLCNHLREQTKGKVDAVGMLRPLINGDEMDLRRKKVACRK